jgi:hypothetical protein
MPVQSNPAIQNVPSLAWDGTAASAADIRKHIRFGWSFEVTSAIAVDAVFKVQAAPASAVDNCVAGVFSDVAAMPTCVGAAVAGAATITIPLGTAIGTICSGTIPCRPGAVSGTTASVKAILVRQGPL